LAESDAAAAAAANERSLSLQSFLADSKGFLNFFFIF